ncbi:hypothetical protein DCAR_0414733 [Daucus carota subsp. sativus]|uniref:Large ribosomal subunit protein mL45 n=1 Tax=Daucus carota subsp. sativus TaxID=79200 RepID=A0AAF1AX06_DAUCS|nr:hypothetical protein DCAR_0414733 [Daucus carota subsp. sativus]
MICEITHFAILGASRNYHSHVAGIYSNMLNGSCERHWTCGHTNAFRSTMVVQQPIFWNHQRMVTTQTKAPAQARHKGTQLSMQSPGFVIEPYTPRERIAFWRRCFTRSGWRRTKDDIILELKNAYAISKLRKKGYSKQKFYTEAFNLYKEINSHIATRDKASLRKAVTENMYSTLKNEIKQRQSVWSSVYLELIEPAVKIRTLRARMIAIDKDDLSKFFMQLTLEFLTKQKFEAYDSSGAIVAGDKDKEVLVRDIWVFEKSFFHPNSYWRLSGQLLQVPGNDGPAPLNNRVADVKTTMPHVPPARRVKKSVSISENVEEIVPSKKWNRKIYGMDNEDVKPLKSILKVGSRIREKQ